MDLNLVNRHWKEGFLYNYHTKRVYYESLLKTLKTKYIVTLVGLRRTGKTTLMKQLIDYLISNNTPRESILFYTFDEPAELNEVINNYLKTSSKNLDKEPLYFFLDEIQKLGGWQNKVKVYYDHYPHIKFILSGSSSLFIKKKSESLAGRLIEFRINPLSFHEFLIFRGKEEFLRKINLFSSEIRREFETYASRQFIDIINEPESRVKEYVENLARKIIFEDVPSVYPIEQPQIVWKLFKIISNNPGMLIDYHNLSSDLSINEKTLSNYAEYLEQAFLIKKIYNYAPNQLTSEKKLKKVYPVASSFCIADMTKVVESLVVTQLPTEFFWKRTHEVDCIVIDDKQLLPIEVKYTDAVKENDLKGLHKFMELFKVKQGIVLTKNLEKKGTNIKFLPAWKFLLQRD